MVVVDDSCRWEPIREDGEDLCVDVLEEEDGFVGGGGGLEYGGETVGVAVEESFVEVEDHDVLGGGLET